MLTCGVGVLMTCAHQIASGKVQKAGTLTSREATCVDAQFSCPWKLEVTNAFIGSAYLA
jgi:hypothetical protein